MPTATTPGFRSAEKTLGVVDAPVASLRPHPRNPRRITPARLEQLQRTLTAEPAMLQARPVIALPDGTVVAGNQRLAAAVALGWETIPTVFADLTEEQQTRWMLLDNRGFGEDDEGLLADLLAELQTAGADIALTGLDGRVVDRLLRSLRPQSDPDAVPSEPGEPKSERGVVYQLGPHLVMCGDAASDSDVRELFAPPAHHALDLVDCIWTDPPYGVSYVGKTADALTIQGDGDGVRELVADAFRAVRPGLAPHARFYVASPAGPRHSDFLSAINDVGWSLHQTLVWVKHRFVLGHSDYHYRHEPILYGWAASVEWPGRPGRGAQHGSRWYGDNAQDSVFEVPAPSRSTEHPTMKPVELIERMLVNATERGAIVYDPFGGSGSTLIACERLDRRARLMEVDPVYCDVIRQRYADYTSQPELAP